MVVEKANDQEHPRAALEYILDMMDQLAKMASTIGERQLGDALGSTAEMRRGCEPVHKDRDEPPHIGAAA